MQSIRQRFVPASLHQSFLFFLTTPHYFIVLPRYAASQLVLFFLRHIVMAVWQAHRGGKLLGVAIWILEAIPGSIKTLTLAKSLVSLSYHADGVGKGCSRSGTRELQVGQRLQIQSSLTRMGDGCQECLRLGYKEPQCQNKERATHTQAAPLHKPQKLWKKSWK